MNGDGRPAPADPGGVASDAGRGETGASGEGHSAIVELSARDLPAYCPNPKMPLWSWHPRVFLDVVNEPEAMCPYCGTRYRLAAGVHERDFDTLGLHQHHLEQLLRPDAAPAPSSSETVDHREGVNLRADVRGNTTLEQITRWLTHRPPG